MMTDHQFLKTPDEFDVQVGARVRMRRKHLGISQGDLAQATGLTFQQIQKYERGSNRISCSKLRLIAKRLGVPMSDLLGENIAEGDQEAHVAVLRLSDQAFKLAAGFDRIESSSQRRVIVELVEAIVEAA